jgi:tryptophan synthase beta chain
LTAHRNNSFRTGPDEHGHFGIFGGRFVAETLMPLILDLEQAYKEAKADPAFQAELDFLATHYVGRPSPLYHAERMSAHLGGAKIYFKRDELNHTGAHKINNVLGQILLACRMGKTRIIAVNMVWQPPPPAPNMDLNALSIWALSMSSGKSQMCFA